MIALLRILLKMLPWLIVVALLSWLLIAEKFSNPVTKGSTEVYQNVLLTRIDAMGKLELVKYNFQEVTEIKRIADYIDLKLFKYKLTPDSRAILISQGSATGCVDLSSVSKKDVSEKNDTLYVLLPHAELCYYKIDMEKSRLYDLEISGLSHEERKNFMEKLYKTAEKQVHESAMNLGILEKTEENARTMLEPLFENIAGKPVVIRFRMASSVPAPI